jgi:GntR family transcriptional regulator
LHEAPAGGTINHIMFDIQHDSPIPIHEQIVGQLCAHVASGALKPGARLPEYRVLAQQLLTNPQAVARAYSDLEWEAVLQKDKSGAMEVVAGAPVICRVRLQDAAKRSLRQAAVQARMWGLADSEIVCIVQEALTAAPPSLSAGQVQTAIQKPTHERSHRDLSAFEEVSGQGGAGSAEPDRAGGGDIRPAR